MKNFVGECEYYLLRSVKYLLFNSCFEYLEKKIDGGWNSKHWCSDFRFLECFNCQWVRGSDVEQKAIFEAGWNCIFIYLYIYIYIYIYKDNIYIYIYKDNIYIYIERERERGTETKTEGVPTFSNYLFRHLKEIRINIGKLYQSKPKQLHDTKS